MSGHARVKGIYGGPVASKLKVPVTKDLLQRLGQCLVESFVKEAKKDFAKRGWSGLASDGSPPIWDSFSYKIRGESTLEIVSTFPFIEEMVSKDTKPYKMTWLTQEAKRKNPGKFPVTPKESRLQREGKLKPGKRLPLVVPLKSKSGKIIFRTAPLTTGDAWIHPGIARFTFAQRAVRFGKQNCIKILREEAVRALVQEMNR